MDKFVEIEVFGKLKYDFLEKFLNLNQNTIKSMFSITSFEKFINYFIIWANEIIRINQLLKCLYLENYVAMIDEICRKKLL